MMYAESRLPGVSREAFLRRWRQHGAFAMTQPGFWSRVVRYVHRDPILDVAAFPGARADYDALGEIAYASLDDLRASLDSEDLRIRVRGDGTLTFARTRTLRAVVKEQVPRDDGPGRFDVAAFVAAPGEAAEAVHARVVGLHQSLLASSPVFSACTRRIVASPVVEAGRSDEVISFVELAYDTIDDAAAGYGPWRAALEQESAGRWRVDALIATRNVLYDSAALAARPGPLQNA